MKPLTQLLVFGFAAVTLILTLFMPAAELIPAQVHPEKPAPGVSPLHNEELMKVFADLAKPAVEVFARTGSMQEGLKKDPNFPYYAYAVFLGGALCCAAIAINAIGRLDSEEKTIIPVKK